MKSESVVTTLALVANMSAPVFKYMILMEFL